MSQMESITRYGGIRKRLTLAMNTFPVGMTRDRLFGEWSVADYAAHFNGWDNLTNLALKEFNEGRSPTWGGEVEEINRKSIVDRADK